MSGRSRSQVRNPSTNSVSSTGNTTELQYWFFKFANGDDFGIIVEGYKSTDKLGTNLVNWGSSPIVRRVNATLLATKSGSLYKLEGPISEKEAREIGIPMSLIMMFQHGFPQNWNKVLQDFWNVLKKTNPLNASMWFEKTAHKYDLSNGTSNDVSMINPRPSMMRKSIMAPPAASPLPEESESMISTPAASAPSSPTATTSKAAKAATSNSADSTEQQRRSRSLSRSASVSPPDGSLRRSPRISQLTSKLGDKAKEQINVVRQRSSTVDSTLKKNTLFTPAPIFKFKRTFSESTIAMANEKNNSNNNEKRPDRQKRGSSVAECGTSKDAASATPIKTKSALSKTTPSKEDSPRKKKRMSTVTIRSPAVVDTAIITPRKNGNAEMFVAPSPDIRGAGKRHSRLSSSNAKDGETKESLENESANTDLIVSVHASNKSSVRFPNKEVVLSNLPSTSNATVEKNSSDKRKGSVADKWKNVDKRLTGWCIIFMDDESIKKAILPATAHPVFSVTGFSEDVAWGSSPIVEIKVCPNGSQSTHLLSSSSKVYMLDGEIDRKYANSKGLSNKFIHAFRNGFPYNWLELLWEERRRASNRGPATSQSSGNVFDASRVVNLTKIASSAPVVTHPDDEMEVIPAYNSPVMSHMMPLAEHPIETVGQLVPIKKARTESLVAAHRRSSYGRTIHEPVQHWKGERVRYSMDGNSMGVEVSQHRQVSKYDDRLAAEKRGNKPTAVKRKRITYSDSEDDAFPRHRPLAIEPPRYHDDIEMRGGSRKYRTVSSDSEDDQRRIDEKLANVKKEKKKLRQRMRELDDLELELEEEALAIRKRKNKLKKLRQEHARLDEMEAISHRHSKKSHHPPPAKKHQKEPVRKNQRAGYNDVSDEDDFNDYWPYEKNILDDDENRSSSTETDCSDGGDWRRGKKNSQSKQHVVVKSKKKHSANKKPAAKTSKKKPTVEYSDSDEDVFEEEDAEESSDITSGEDSDVYVEPVEMRKKPTWRKEDVDRLKAALDRIVIKKDSDWEKVSRSLGSTWDAEECKEAAIKKLKWKPKDTSREEHGEMAEPVVEVTSKKGTFKYAKETGQQMRDYMLAAGSQGDDYFGTRQERISSAVEDETIGDADDEVMEPNLDNSLLAAMKTPTVINKKAARRSIFYPDDNTPSTSNDREVDDELNVRGAPVDDDADREQRTKYLHQLTHRNRTNMNNTSRANNSTFMNQKNADNTLLDVTRRVDAIQKKAKQTIKKNRRLTEYDENDEDEENALFD